jgi:Rubisco Assembly chaperone C-terminal domain/Rubisco accumulation factor 1 alpha helical domain/Rubisco accumulation factor 1 helix turn helix domain
MNEPNQELAADRPQAGVEAETEIETLLRSLRRKEGDWVAWGQACQSLQKAGYSPQAIFEATGFEPIQQNQIITAAQIYGSLSQASPAVQDYFQTRGSDVLYEFRILTQPERVAAASLSWEKKLDADAAHDLAKAMKDFSRLPHPPADFTAAAGDAVAYQCWKLARQKEDMQERSRLIARGLNYAQSDSARQQIEKLLTDFTVEKAQSAPRLPLYRLDSEEELPRIVPVVGHLPLTPADLESVPVIEQQGPFRLVQSERAGVAIPGWQVMLRAGDPVALLARRDQLPTDLTSPATEELLVIVDRQQQQWRADSHFLVEQSGELAMAWFATEPETDLLAQVILVMRPKQILDESAMIDPWGLEE